VRGFNSAAVHILVTRGARVLPTPGVIVRVHESRRFTSADILPCEPPTTSLDRATIDAAVWSEDIKTATRIVAAVVQQRRTTPENLKAVLLTAGLVKHRKPLLMFLADLSGGAEALSEVAFLQWCRRHHFPCPRTQVRLDVRGRRRYLDATFELPNGEVLMVEIDGGVHLNLTTRWLDTAKDNDAVITGRMTLRFPSVAIYSDDPRAVGQLREALEVVMRRRGHRPASA
jgi:hypothetical protein